MSKLRAANAAAIGEATKQARDTGHGLRSYMGAEFGNFVIRLLRMSLPPVQFSHAFLHPQRGLVINCTTLAEQSLRACVMWQAIEREYHVVFSQED